MRRAKKTEKSSKSEATDGDKEAEPYQCTGNFHNDFHELCGELNLYREIPILLRPKRPISPSHNEQNVVQNRKGKEDKKAQPVDIPDEETPEEKEAIELLGFKPKTFVLKNHVDMLRPCICVEMDNPDKQDTVTEVFLRSWRLELNVLSVLSKCFTKLQKLHSLNLWRVGTSAVVITELAQMLSHLENLKHLNLESNDYIAEENYAELIRPDSHLVKLSLRFNSITQKGAKLLSEQLGTLTSTNSRLITLDLSNNSICDEGAIALAQGLRTNRTLIALSLSSNRIGDIGATALAHVCSRFFLTHTELIQRRKMLSTDRGPAGSPPPSRRGADRDRPTSTRSTEKDKKSGRDVKVTKGKKEEKGKADEKGKGKFGGKDDGKSRGKANTAAVEKSTGDSKGGGKLASKGSRGARVKVTTPQPEAEQDSFISVDHPLLERAELIGGSSLLIPGNYVLAMLNLSRNRIGKKGIAEWKTAIAYQTAYMNLYKVTGSGLLKLMLSGNNFLEEDENYKSLDDMMQARNPLRPSISADDS